MNLFSRAAPTDVLVVIDVQNDFCPGGALAVPGGDEILPLVNRLAECFEHVVMTQDWHPPDQISFASIHGAEPFSMIEAPYGPQVLWPDHCVQGSKGAEFHPLAAEGLVKRAELILRKGYNPRIDSYSAFYENDRTSPTGLGGYLKERGLKRCVFVGLALDYCVRYSAEDAIALGFASVVLMDATRAIDLNGSRAEAIKILKERGVGLLTTDGD